VRLTTRGTGAGGQAGADRGGHVSETAAVVAESHLGMATTDDHDGDQDDQRRGVGRSTNERRGRSTRRNRSRIEEIIRLAT
jgi:hypothetical protein